MLEVHVGIDAQRRQQQLEHVQRVVGRVVRLRLREREDDGGGLPHLDVHARPRGEGREDERRPHALLGLLEPLLGLRLVRLQLAPGERKQLLEDAGSQHDAGSDDYKELHKASEPDAHVGREDDARCDKRGHQAGVDEPHVPVHGRPQPRHDATAAGAKPAQKHSASQERRNGSQVWRRRGQVTRRCDHRCAEKEVGENGGLRR